MSVSVISLLGLISWSILLTFLVILVRAKSISAGTINFEQDGSDLPGFAERVTRAHGNSLENLAIPAALILYGLASDQSGVTDGLAMIVLAARVAQSVIHMASAAFLAVLLRATFFVVQVAIWIIWILGFYGA